MKALLKNVVMVVLLSALGMSQAFAADSAATSMTPSVFDQFNQTQVLKVELSLDMEALHANKKTNNYQKAKFSIIADDQIKTYNVKVRARGRFRRVKSEMPPLKLKFSKKELIAQGLSEDNDYKLVTHFYDSKEGDDAVLREYLAYKLYNQLSGQSFRVQLAKVTYRDKVTDQTNTRYGILIEDSDQMADRLGGDICDECYNRPEGEFDATNVQLHALFQYMIGNTDWSLAMNRNLKLVKVKQTGKFVAVPYDFDFSGFVNASYAIPNADYQLPTIRDRAFLGPQNTPQALAAAKGMMIAKRAALEKTITDFKLMSRKSRKDLLEYMDSFYTALETQQKL